MDADEFGLVRAAFRSFSERAALGSADVKPASRAAAQRALDGLGLAELRGSSPPLATAQECALLAEDHGTRPLATSFLGTVLLAPELLRLLGQEPEGTPTIALAPDLRFPATQDLIGWDCEGADSALSLAPDGTVTRLALGPTLPSVDFGRPLRAVADPAPALGRLDRAAVRQWQAFALVMVSSELVGAARSIVEQAVGYARDRRQYGQAIGSFQAVQHLLADATVGVEAGTSATRYAAWCLDHEPGAAALHAARVAKAEVNASALDAVYAAAQVFGGIAQTWEHVAHLYLRKIRVGALTLATTTDLLTVLTQPVGAR